MTKTSRGFTVIELLLIIVVTALASVLFFIQKNNIEVVARDNQRKTAINAMYYSLEEVFYTSNNFYPQLINKTNLPSVAPELFADPFDVTIGDGASDYRYEATNCIDTKCKGYTLRSSLENEADFIKESRNR